MQAAIRYLIEFLVRDADAAKRVGYTSDPAEYNRYAVVIRPSGWLEQVSDPSRASLPHPFDFLGMPVLFGSPQMADFESTCVVSADWVASAYYLLTRYEEYQNPVRDAHGRFPGKESLLYRLDWLDRPLVDAYGRQLRVLLQKAGVQTAPVLSGTVVLTHDIDSPRRFHNLRSVLGGIRRRQWRLLADGMHGRDPYADWDGITRMDGALPWAEQRFFAHMAGPTGQAEDAACLPLRAADWEKARQLDWGVHFSARAARDCRCLLTENAQLTQAFGRSSACCRFHYLLLPDPEGWNTLEESGITDDYSVGYADVPGFRMGTCRPVRYIDPLTGRLSATLTLHPLALMDVTLSDYARLPFAEALSVAEGICRKACEWGGEAVLLWHNSSLAQGTEGYHRSLYIQLLDSLAQDGVGKPSDTH